MLFSRASIFSTLMVLSAAHASLIPHRLEPVQGINVLEGPPIAHNHPDTAGNTAHFIDPISSKVIDDYKDLGRVKQVPAPKRLVRNNLGVFSYASKPESVFYLLHLSDFQLVDEESPVLTPTNDFILDGRVYQGAYRIHSPYIVHTANALIKRGNELAEQTRPYDLVLHTGDAIETAQKNELDWFLTLMNGGTVHPDSGEKIDLIRGGQNDPNDPLIAPGVKSPWLSVTGNHDIVIQGNFPHSFLALVNAPGFSQLFTFAMAQNYITVPSHPTAALRRGGLTDEQYYLMPVDFDDDNQANDQQIAGLNLELELGHLLSHSEFRAAFNRYFNQGQIQEQSITPDANRKAIDRCGFIKAHMAQVGIDLESGFGFTEKNLPVNGRCTGHYTYEPKDNDAIRIISLDTTKEYGGADGALSKLHKPFQREKLIDENGEVIWDLTTSQQLSQGLTMPGLTHPLFMVPYAQGELDPTAGGAGRDPITFLKTELERAKTDQKLVIVQSHHASDLLSNHNDLRIELEVLLCGQLGLPKQHCNPNGVLATGLVGESKAIANQRALGLFTNIVAKLLQQPLASPKDIKQAHINALAQANPKQFSMLVAAFHMLFTFRQLMPDPIEPMDTKSFRKLLAQYPNVALHLVGHSHQHKILAICTNGEAVHELNGRCIDKGGEHGEGYYEIRTAASSDWPQEQRILELVDNNDGSLSIYGTIYHAPLGKDMLVEVGRRLALADVMTTPGSAIDQKQDLNVHLLVNIPDAIDQALDGVDSRNQSIESKKF